MDKTKKTIVATSKHKYPLALLFATAAFTTSSLITGQAQAAMNIQAGVNSWKPSPSGYIQGNKHEEKLSVKNSLGLSSNRDTNFYVQLDHPVLLVPNIRVSRTNLDFSANKSHKFEFLGHTFDGDLNTQVDLTHTDITAYYRFLDGISKALPLIDLRLELGVNVRVFDGEFSVTDSSGFNKSISLNSPVPMGHAGFRLGVPLGLSFGAQIDGISYSGNRLTDLTLDARYEYDGLPLIKPGLTAGYRNFKAKLDDLSDTYGDLTLDGAFFGAYIKIGF